MKASAILKKGGVKFLISLTFIFDALCYFKIEIVREKYMSIWKGILTVIKNNLDIVDGLHDVPSQDGFDNIHMRDVIGNKNDGHNSISISGQHHRFDDHFHSVVFCRPELSDSIQLTKAAGVWAALPAPTEIIAAGQITNDFDLHFLNISEISANGEYEIALYQGGAGNEILIGCFGVIRTAVQSQEGSRNIITPLILANTRISAALSSGNAAQNTINIKLEGHEY